MCCIVGNEIQIVVASLLKLSLRGVTHISRRWVRFLRSVVTLCLDKHALGSRWCRVYWFVGNDY